MVDPTDVALASPRRAHAQEELQREWQRRSGTLSMVEHNMAASPGFHQQQLQPPPPPHQQQSGLRPQEQQQRGGFDASRLPETPDSMQKLRFA